MGEKDISERTFISLDDVFSDIFNVLVFQGKQVVTADSLEDSREFSQYKADTGKLHEQERDTCKLWRGHGINLVLVGVESQSLPDRDMPFRVFSYDGASYRSQLLKEGRERYPVVTIVLYFGASLWNYPMNLKDCFYPALPEDEITKVLDGYIQDYRANVFDIPRLTMETVRQFRSDFRVVAEYFVNAYTNPDYMPDDVTIIHVDEFLKLMKVLTGDSQYSEIAKSYADGEKKEVLKMCNVLAAREAKGRAEGEAKGRAEGEAKGRAEGEAKGRTEGEARLGKLVAVLLGLGKNEEALKVATDDKFREECYVQYGI